MRVKTLQTTENKPKKLEEDLLSKLESITKETSIENIVKDYIEQVKISVAFIGDNTEGIIDSMIETTIEDQLTSYVVENINSNIFTVTMKENFTEKIDWIKINTRKRQLYDLSFWTDSNLPSEIIENFFLNPEIAKNNHLIFQYATIPEIVVHFKKEIDFLIPFDGYYTVNTAIPSNHSNIKNFQGKQIRFCGLGQNIQADLSYLKLVLHSLYRSHSSNTDSIIIRLPCSTLRGNKEFIHFPYSKNTGSDSTSSNSSDSSFSNSPSSSSFLFNSQPNVNQNSPSQSQNQFSFTNNNASSNPANYDFNCLICVVGSEGLNEYLRKFLVCSGFLYKLLRNPKEYQIVFVIQYRNQYSMNQNNLSENDVKQVISRQYLALLKEHAPGPYSLIAPVLASQIKIISVNPLQYTSFSMISTPSYRHNKYLTGIPTLFSIIDNLVIFKTADSVKNLSSEWIKQQQSTLVPSNHSIPASSPLSPPAKSLSVSNPISKENHDANQIPRSIRLQFESIKQEIITDARIFDNGLALLSKQAFIKCNEFQLLNQPTQLPGRNENLSASTSSIPIIPSSSSFSASSPNSLLSSSPIPSSNPSLNPFLFNQSNKHKSKSTNSNESNKINVENQFNQIISDSLLANAPTFWKDQILSKLPEQMRKITLISSNLLKECLQYNKSSLNSFAQYFAGPNGTCTTNNSSNFHQNNKMKDKSQLLEQLRLKHLIDFCNLIQKRTEDRINDIIKSLLSADPEQLIKNSLNQANNSLLIHQNTKQMDCFPSNEQNNGAIQLFNQSSRFSDSLFTQQLAHNLRFSFTKILTDSLSHLSEIEEDIYHSANLMMVALSSNPMDQKKVQTNQPQSSRPSNNQATPPSSDPLNESRRKRMIARGMNNEGYSIYQTMQSNTPSVSEGNALPIQSSNKHPRTGLTGNFVLFNGLNNNIFDYRDWSLLSNYLEYEFNPITGKNQIKENMEEFNEKLACAGLKVKEIEEKNGKGGNSQFECLAYHIYGSESIYPIIRFLISHEILSHSIDYEPFFLSSNIDIQCYINKISKDGEYGDHITLIAFSNLFHVDILIYSPVCHQPILIKSRTHQYSNIISNKVKSNENKIICLAYVDGKYFHPLTFIDFSESLLKKRKNKNFVQEETPFHKKRNESKSVPVELEGKPEIHEEIMKDSKAESEQEENERSEKNVDKLEEMTILTIIKNVKLLPALQGSIPDHLLKKILKKMIELNKMDDLSFEKLILGSSLNKFNFKNSNDMNYLLATVLARMNQNISKLDCSNCLNLSNEALSVLITPNSSHSLSKDVPWLNMKKLMINGNSQIDNSVLQLIPQYCRALTELQVAGSKIQDTTIFDLFENCKDLIRLNLSGCPLVTDSAFVHSCAPIQLKEIDLIKINQITDASIISIAKRANVNLRSIKFSSKKITAKSLYSLAEFCRNLEEIEILHAGPHSLSQDSIQFLFNSCKFISKLTIKYSSEMHSSTFLQPFSNNCESLPADLLFKNVRYLDLTRCLSVNDSFLYSITTSFPSLSELNLSYCEEITDNGICQLIKHSKNTLKSINLSNCKKLTDNSIIPLAQQCSELEFISLSNNSEISNKSLFYLSKLSKLQSLDISSCDKLNEDGLIHLQSCNKLKELVMDECKISDDCFSRIIKNMKDLQLLKIPFCSDIGDHSMEIAMNTCPNLKVLDISYCNSISVEVIQALLQHFPKLEQLHLRGYLGISNQLLSHNRLIQLNLSWCKNLEDECLMNILSFSPSLQILDISWCSKISQDKIQQISKSRPLRSFNASGCTRL